MITKICGFNGAGKTELASMIVSDIMLNQIKHGSIVTEKGIAELNAGGFVGFKTAPHYVFCNWKVKVDYKGVEYHSWGLNPYDLGLFNGVHPIKYYPPGAYIFIDESKDCFNKKNFATFPDFLLNFLTTHRHNDLNIFLLSPSADDDDLEIRKLISQVFSIQKNTNKYWLKWLFGERFFRKSIIKYNVYTGRNCISNAVADMQPVTRKGRKYLLRTGQQLPPVHAESVVYNGNIFKRYSSFSHRWRFYVGATAKSQFAYIDSATPQLTVKELSHKVFNNQYSAPVTWFKSSIKDRKEFEKIKIKVNPFAVAYKEVPICLMKNKMRFYVDNFRTKKRYYASLFRCL